VNIPKKSRHTRQVVGFSLSFIVAFCFSQIAEDWWVGGCWLLGHLLLFMSLFFYQKKISFNIPAYSEALLAALMPIVYLIVVQMTLSDEQSWRGFMHLSDISLRGFAHIMALWAPALGFWLLGTTLLQSLQLKIKDRQKRLFLLIIATVISGLTAFVPGIEIGFLPLTATVGAIVLSQDVYLENERNSMTWLLLWLLFVAVLTSFLAFRQSVKIDQHRHQEIAQNIIQFGEPDSSLAYHLPFVWDTLSSYTAKNRLDEASLSLEEGEGAFFYKEGRSDWIYHRKEGKGFVQVGRSLNSIRVSLSLASLLFLMGLVYYLLMRAINWLLAYPVESLLLPLYGPSSLRIRIQLYFFGLALVAFLLVGWFTLVFFKGQTGIFYNWLEQFISIYAFLLIVAGALGIFLANSITDPIVKIGQKLGNTRLQDNQPLSWPQNDEIGKLVHNYNQMILALDESVEQLAVHERESAWREMAKQVAHEIKNPLTPIKLQLQQLQRFEKEDPEKARAWSLRVTKNIIEQIDGLALIATAFSEFAHLPEAKPTFFDLRELAQAAYDLHLSNRQNARFNIDIPSSECIVYADRDQLLRVLNNLIRNGLQALDPRKEGEIKIILNVSKDIYKLEVCDNGMGVEPSIQSKLFQPNFSTKTSGKGLGLAMCKNIVIQAKGRIGFDTKVGSGSCFYLELPQMEEQGMQ